MTAGTPHRHQVLQEEVAGHHEVTMLTTYKNDAQTDQEMIAENVMVEPVPKIVERGTQTPPTYIKPITGGTMTSTFKWRWGRMHKGIDWLCRRELQSVPPAEVPLSVPAGLEDTVTVSPSVTRMVR